MVWKPYAISTWVSARSAASVEASTRAHTKCGAPSRMTMGTTNPSIYSKEAITERPLRSYVDTAFVNHAPDYSNRSVK